MMNLFFSFSFWISRIRVFLVLTSNADELLRLHSDKLLLEETGTTALDAVQVIVDLVGAVECDVQHGTRGDSVKLDGRQTSADNQLARLVTRGHIAGVGGIDTESLDSLDDVDDSRTAANADPASVFRVVISDGGLCGSALSSFDGFGHCSEVAGEKERGEGRRESRWRKVKVEAGRLRKRARGEAERREGRAEQSRHHLGEREESFAIGFFWREETLRISSSGTRSRGSLDRIDRCSESSQACHSTLEMQGSVIGVDRAGVGMSGGHLSDKVITSLLIYALLCDTRP